MFKFFRITFGHEWTPSFEISLPSLKSCLNFYPTSSFQRSPKLNNIHLRRALSNAIDRKNLVHNVIANGSVPLTSILTDNLKVSKEVTAGNYDLDRAKKELEIAKNELKQNNFTFDILTNDQDLGVKASEFIQGQLNRLEGIKGNIVPVPATVQFDRLSKKEFDLSISGVAADYPDPFSILSNFRKNSPNNHGNYSSEGSRAPTRNLYR